MFYTVVLSSGMRSLQIYSGQIAQVFGTAQSFLAAAALTALPLIGLLIYLCAKAARPKRSNEGKRVNQPMQMNKTSWRLIPFYVLYHITNCFYQTILRSI
jgi:heme/copper-type cytochrome/quinol oxidase subunit 2